MTTTLARRQLVRWYVRRQTLHSLMRLGVVLLRQRRMYVKALRILARLGVTSLHRVWRRDGGRSDGPRFPVDVALTTSRFRIAALRPADLDQVAALLPPARDVTTVDPTPGAWRATSWWQEARLTADMSRAALLLAITKKDAQALIGLITITPLDIAGRSELECGYRIHPAEWGKGIATESVRRTLSFLFDELKCDRIISLIEPSNRSSIRVAEKAGLRYERESMLVHTPVLVFVADTRTWRATDD